MGPESERPRLAANSQRSKRLKEIVLAKKKSKDYAYRRGPIAVVNCLTGAMRCMKCGQEWVSKIKPRSQGRYYRGSWTCSSCGTNSKDQFTQK